MQRRKGLTTLGSKNPPRLLFVTATPLTAAMGSGTYVGIAVLRRALIARGVDVRILAPPSGWEPTLSYTARRLLFNLAVRNALARVDCDLCVGFDLDGVALLDRAKVPVVQSIKGVIGDELTFERGAVRASLWLQSRAELVAVHRADLVMTTSKFAAARIAHHYRYRRPIEIVPEGIDLAAWEAAFAGATAEPREMPTVLCVAHLYPRKDVRSLVEAIAILKRRGRAAAAHIVGHGPCEGDLAAQIARVDVGDRVRLLGHVPFAQLAREYRSASAFCLPSRQEGFGIVYLEAMAAGLPIVACRAAAVPEVVADGECGLLAPPSDSAGLADAIERIVLDRDLAARLGAAGRERVRRYDAPRLAEGFLEAVSLA
jgi:glycosyltransferase involved in cell wall biosynthesis